MAFPTPTGEDWWGLWVEGPNAFVMRERQYCCEDEDGLTKFQALHLARGLQFGVMGSPWKLEIKERKNWTESNQYMNLVKSWLWIVVSIYPREPTFSLLQAEFTVKNDTFKCC